MKVRRGLFAGGKAAEDSRTPRRRRDLLAQARNTIRQRVGWGSLRPLSAAAPPPAPARQSAGQPDALQALRDSGSRGSKNRVRRLVREASDRLP